jgi:chemotaxis protein CheX
MNVEFINPFLSATIDVLKTMAFTEVKPLKPIIKKNAVAEGDISGVIGITGPSLGSMSLTFPEVCILKIVSNMLGEEHKEMNEEIKDAVGELTNMISGAARNELGKSGYSFRTSIPMIITGKAHQIKHRCNAPIIALPFEAQGGTFIVEISFED